MLEIRNVSKRYGEDIQALHEVSLNVAQGEVVALLGPSGCGKTTLLRIVAGLESMDSGSIALDGSDLAQIPIHRRNFGFMFQDFALFPHQSVADNIAFGLRMRHAKPSEIQSRVEEMLQLVNLPGYGRRSIFELSGGERQRVALARSLAPNPRLLMLDEPLGSLDRNLRESLALDLRAILRAVGVTAIYVTHDQQEALVMSDRVAIMRRGHIEQIDAPEVVYRQPATEFVARFLGFRNLIPISGVQADGKLITALGAIPMPRAYEAGHTNPNTTSSAVWSDGEQRALLIRPESARVRTNSFYQSSAAGSAPTITQGAPRQDPEQGRISVRGTLVTCVFMGIEYRIAVDVPPLTNLRVDSSVEAESYRLHFDIPSHQMDIETGTLMPTSLPETGSEIVLSLFPDLMSIVPGAPALH